jgi:hypothetical protein
MPRGGETDAFRDLRERDPRSRIPLCAENQCPAGFSQPSRTGAV